jgi:hypothetical protein
VTAVPDRSAERVVWTGRSQIDVPGGLDGWTTSDDDLTASLEHAAELVVLDPLSFPWRTVSGARRDIPLVVRLPEEVGSDDLIALLGRPLLQHVTPCDRLVETRQDVRDSLVEEFGLPLDVWVSAVDKTPPDPSVLARKTAFRQVVRLVAAEVRRFLGDSGEGLVGFVDRAVLLARHVERATDAAVVDSSLGVPATESPEVVVVWLRDGGQTATERTEILSHAVSLLHPGGRLVVVANVVTEPGGAPNPTISVLVEEILNASHMLVHVEELRAVRWGAEPMARGALISLTSLRTGRI